MKQVKLLILLVTLLALVYVPVSYAEQTGIIIIGETVNSNGSVPYSTSFEELQQGIDFKVSGDFSINCYQCTCWGNDVIYNGRRWGYLDSKENGIARKYWYPKRGVDTLLYISISLTNRSKENTNFGNRLSAELVYDDKYVFAAKYTQYNDGQTDSNGKKCDSIVAADVEPLMAADGYLVFDIPYIVRDSDKPLKAYITIDDTYVYQFNVREYMVVDNG